MKIGKKEWNEVLIGYCCETDSGKYFQVQFELEQNRLHADYNKFSPILDLENNYDIDLTEEEKASVITLIKHDRDFLNKAEELSNESRR